MKNIIKIKASKDKQEKIVTVVIWRGCVTDVKGLPEGYKYKIKDHDVYIHLWKRLQYD